MGTIENKKLISIKRMHKIPKTLYTEFVGIDVSENKLNVYETKNNQFFKDFFHLSPLFSVG
jgi:hypothetical protein